MRPPPLDRRAAIEERRTLRNEVRIQRELARRLKELAKLSELEQARLEVEAFENELAVLHSVHKGEIRRLNWNGMVAEPPPLSPFKSRFAELKASWNAVCSGESTSVREAMLGQARAEDQKLHEVDSLLWRKSFEAWEQMRLLARGVLNGDGAAFIRALEELNPFEEISGIGSSLEFTTHTRKVIEARLKVAGNHVVPREAKTLTKAGMLSVKAIPKKRHKEIYEDYVCACILRVAREVFALLPVEIVLVTALLEQNGSDSDARYEIPVCSVYFERASLESLSFAELDPSDTINRFQHRGDLVTANRELGFVPINPFQYSDLPIDGAEEQSFSSLLERLKLERGLATQFIESLPKTEPAEADEIEVGTV
jgi:hypothetical protein